MQKRGGSRHPEENLLETSRLGGARRLTLPNSNGILAIGVQMVNHSQMTCQEAIDAVLDMMSIQATQNQRTILIAELIARTSSPPLDDENSHSEWTGDVQFDSQWLEDIQWNHTNALRQYRDTHSNLSENAKQNLEIVARRIIGNSFNPNGEESEFHWRGLVVGNVQSGKTATYSTLIARALDVGYRLIIVLSGRLDSLRRQTSSRLHAELVNAAPAGVNVNHLTIDDDSIFAYVSGQIFNYISGEVFNHADATLIVAKKDYTRMRQLNDLLIAIRNRFPGFSEFPILVIDDECDEAGVDIGNNDDTSANHFEIRRLISNPIDGTITREITRPSTIPNEPPIVEEETRFSPCFRKTMYVGFTATPYATVFQEMNESDEENERRGLDLYPRDYLLVLDDPPNYCGGEVFIGRYQIDDEQGADNLQLPEIESSIENLVDLPMNHACENCLQEEIETVNGRIRTHIGHQNYKHFWHTGGREHPIPASQFCDCTCHKNDESHLIKNPFNDSIENFQPQIVSSLRNAIDDFILAGAARIQRGQNHLPSSMMILISHNSYQHFRIREVVEDWLSTISESWPMLGHRARMRERWETSFEQNAAVVNQGFELVGGGRDTHNPNRLFEPRPVPLSTEFEEIQQYIPQFIHSLRHVVLNSGVQSSQEEGDKLDFNDAGFPVLNGSEISNLKAIYYGGFSLGRGLTLKGLTTTYVMRLPGDGSVATQIQRWCGYRMWPGEDILDLSRVYMPEVLSMTYRELLTVETINRFRLSLHSKADPPNRPESVFHYLREPDNGFSLVSAAKTGRMETILNPLAGREKTETTFRFTTDGNDLIAANWNEVNSLLQSNLQMQEVDIETLNSGFLLNNVPVESILNLIANWSSVPHSQSGYNLSQITNYIQLLVENEELERWSIFLPSRSHGNEIQMRDWYDASTDFPPLQDYNEIELSRICPFARVINGRRVTTQGPTFRIGTITSPNWRTIDLQDAQNRRPIGSNPLLIITSIIHPFNRVEPFSTTYTGLFDQIISESQSPWPIVPSLSFVFPDSETSTGTELGHDQFNQN